VGAVVPTARALLLALLLIGFVSTPVRACPVPAGGSAALEAVDPAARLAFLRTSLNHEARRAATWSTLWVGANAVLIAGTGGLIPFYPKENRVDLIVGIGATTIAALPLVLLPPSIEIDGPAFDKHVARGHDLCLLIAEGEHLVAKDAREAAGVYTWFPQVANVVYNLGVGLILGLAFHRWVPAIGAFFSGVTIGELVMLTEPKELSWDFERYMDARLHEQAPGLAWEFLPAPNGLSFHVTF
jgi:hypothetical protein